MSQLKELSKSIPIRTGKIYRGRARKFVIKVEAIIYAKNIEGRNYALTRTAVGYPSITRLNKGEFERLKSQGVSEISLIKAVKIQDDFLSCEKKDAAKLRRSQV